MSHSAPDDADLVADEAALRRLYGATHELARQKCLGALDRHGRDFVARSPFLCLSIQDRSGRADVSPRGDPPGFVAALDDTTLAIVVAVDEVFLHRAKAFRRSRLWDPEARQDRRGMPSLSKMVLEQTAGAPADPAEMERIDAGLETEYRDTMY